MSQVTIDKALDLLGAREDELVSLGDDEGAWRGRRYRLLSSGGVEDAEVTGAEVQRRRAVHLVERTKALDLTPLGATTAAQEATLEAELSAATGLSGKPLVRHALTQLALDLDLIHTDGSQAQPGPSPQPAPPIRPRRR